MRFAETVTARNTVLPAQELVAAKVHLLVPISLISVDVARAAAKPSRSWPSIWKPIPSPSGLAAALAHPGGNVTGVFFDFPDFSTKWMELLKEVLPQLTTLIVIRSRQSVAR